MFLHEPLTPAAREQLREYDDLTAALLFRRGITTKEDADRFLNPSYENHLHDPLLMKNMRPAAERLGAAILSGERITVWGDYDCDGIPGGVILHDFLKKAGANFENYIPHRHDEGYGVNEAGIEKVAARGTTLVVTVDSGITDVVAIKKARALGMDVIVTDHHLPGTELPDAIIVDPKAHPDETYPFLDLCGAGLAWKLSVATLMVSDELRVKIPVGWEKWLLDMAGLATIADMVPLHGENRVIAKYGLLVMRKSPRLGLQKLCRAMRTYQSALTEDDVGFMIAPRVNAASRMGDARDAFELFTTDDETRADLLSKKLEKLNRERKAQAGAITRAVREQLASRQTMRSVIALGDPAWRPSLLGLVANSIAEEYERPVFLWGREGNHVIKGSCRAGLETEHVVELMTSTTDTFEQFGGHAQSGGFTVKEDAIFVFEDRLVEAYERMRALRGADQQTPTLRADAEVLPQEVTRSFLTTLEKLAPFGERNEKPVFLLRDVVLTDISRFGKSTEHLKIKITVPERSQTIDAVTFFAKGALGKMGDAVPKGSRANILAHIERDTFSRTNPVRLRLLDIVLL